MACLPGRVIGGGGEGGIHGQGPQGVLHPRTAVPGRLLWGGDRSGGVV